jgi:hypothetical protein
MTNDVVGYLVVYSSVHDGEPVPGVYIEFTEQEARKIVEIFLQDKRRHPIHLYKSVNGVLTEIELSEGNDE